MGHKPKHKIHLCFIYSLYTEPEGILDHILNIFLHETKFVYTEPSESKYVTISHLSGQSSCLHGRIWTCATNVHHSWGEFQGSLFPWKHRINCVLCSCIVTEACHMGSSVKFSTCDFMSAVKKFQTWEHVGFQIFRFSDWGCSTCIA